MKEKSRMERSWLKKWIKKRTDWYYDEGKECSEFKWWIMGKLIIFIPLMALIYFFTKSEYETFSVFFLLFLVLFFYWLSFGVTRQVLSIAISLIVMGKLGLFFYLSRVILTFKGWRNVVRTNYFILLLSLSLLWFDHKTGEGIVLSSIQNHVALKLIIGIFLLLILKLTEKDYSEKEDITEEELEKKSEEETERKKEEPSAPEAELGSFQRD